MPDTDFSGIIIENLFNFCFHGKPLANCTENYKEKVRFLQIYQFTYGRYYCIINPYEHIECSAKSVYNAANKQQ